MSVQFLRTGESLPGSLYSAFFHSRVSTRKGNNQCAQGGVWDPRRRGVIMHRSLPRRSLALQPRVSPGVAHEACSCAGLMSPRIAEVGFSTRGDMSWRFCIT